MPALYIGATEAGAGKTALATALASHLFASGRRVRLVRPLRLAQGNPPPPERDAPFYPTVVPGQPHPQGWPITTTPQALEGDPSHLERALQALRDAAREADWVVVEGLDCADGEGPVARASAQLASALAARVVLVARFHPDLSPQQLSRAASPYGRALAGLLLNRVTRYRTLYTRRELLPALRNLGLPTLGAIPEDRRMLAPTVQQVAEHLGGEIIPFGGPEAAQALVEHFMVGGWFLDPGWYVFSREERKAVVVRADRPDLQMAALETDTVCLILTGGREPFQYVLQHCEERGVPIVLTPLSTLAVMEALGSMPLASVHHPEKPARFRQLLEEHADLEALLAGLARA